MSDAPICRDPDLHRSTVIGLAPYWLHSEISRLLGERAIRATREGDVDEMRRLTEGVEWLKRRVYYKPEAAR